jgi:GGDEF domain-containing protein
VSIGIAVYPQDGGTIDELLVAADRALYRDKDTSKRRLRLPR